ncbi:MAG: tRNA glutamyl-Q(34) synthetase GluQRS [Deltaproteobacteria bacterium]|nr:tRNA glutamyl-Q(34) synthetase GluQRS [Deltaproteobacteria bacterium]
MPAEQVIGRFAPSPTGPLHFGSLIAAVGSYCLARREGGTWLLRMEDLDPPRVVAGAADEILFALEKLGLHWDGDILWQSQRTEAYAAAMDSLRVRGLIFDCACTRREIRLHTPFDEEGHVFGEEGPVYPGTCRAGLPAGRKPRTLRIRVPEEQVCFTDGVFGPLNQMLSRDVGDFILRRADGLFAYQLAVVVDDAESGINQVVRGADLLSSTPRQIFLNASLGTAVQKYVHLPLVVDENGKKLSKQQGALGIDYEGNAGGLISEALGFLGQELPAELVGAPPQEQLLWAIRHFDLKRIST